MIKLVNPRLALLSCLFCCNTLLAQPKRPAGLPKVVEGFSITNIASGLTAVTAMEIAPDGRIFVCEQTGALRVIENDKLLDPPCLKVKVDPSWERGLIGVTCDPDFSRNGFLYVTYISPIPYPHHVISRFAPDGSEKIFLEGDNQQKMSGTIKNGHQGGALHFGLDGKLYISIGDQTSNAPAQELDTFLGKLLRINSDGTIPAVFLNDVGGAREEINVATHGGQNFGWPTVEHGVNSKEKYSDAIYSYPFASIVGGDFCTVEKCPKWPAEFHGRYFFMDYVHGWIKTLDPEHPTDVKDFAAGLPFPTDLRFSPNGSLYVLVRDMWVNDKSFFKPATGFVVKITPNQSEPR